MNETLHVPPFVNYACSLCGWCCHQYDISFSEEDHERLSGYDWGALEPALEGKEWCAPLKWQSGYAAWRLRYAPDGACVFLHDNKCLMHKHVGELGKTMGCCTYPLSFVGTPTGVYVGCRFSCQSVSGGKGEPLVHQMDDVRKKYGLCKAGRHVPQYGDTVNFDGKQALAWDDYIVLEEALIRVLLRDDLPMQRRLFLFAKFIEVLGQAKLAQVQGERFADLVAILETGLHNEATADEIPKPPGMLARVLFRQFCFQFQRRQGGAYQEMSTAGKMRERLGQFVNGIFFALGRGRVGLPAFPGRVDLKRVSRVTMRPLDDVEEHALSRFLAANLFGKQHFGKFFYDYNLLDGLNFLLLVAGAVIWYARARAVARGVEGPETEDIIEAVRYVDFCYGYSRAPSLRVERARVHILGQKNMAPRAVLGQFG